MKDVLLKLIKANRSYRRFVESEPISMEVLKELVELARFSASGSNLQPLKFYLSNSPERNEKIFSTLAWAGYLRDWEGPAAGERPSAYILILGDDSIRKSVGCDHGIAAQSIMLGAAARGLGGCMIGSIQRKELAAILNLPDSLSILLVLALGKPAENVVLEEAEAGGIEYYRDENDIHHVPKRPLEELIVNPGIG